MNNDKETVLNIFFKSLRIALNNCSVYFREHPLLIKSIEKLQADTNAVLKIIDPFTIGVTTNSLFCADEYWDKETLYVDLAVLLHRRKIKNIEIRKTVSSKELAVFVAKLAMPVLDIYKEGGLAYIFKKEGVVNITVEELDYSSLLLEDGQEQKDIWAYLLKKAASEKNALEIKKLVDNFDAVLEKIKISDFVNNENLKESVAKFLKYLKENDKESFNNCARALIRVISNDKDQTVKDKLKQLSFLSGSLTTEDITGMVCDMVSSDESFNVKSIELFSSLLDRPQNEQVASFLAKRAKKESGYNAAIAKRIKDLLASMEDSSIKLIYQYALSSFLRDVGLEGSLSFDRDQMKKNYRTMVLSLVADDKSALGFSQIAENIYLELKKALAENDVLFAQNFLEIINKKINSGGKTKSIFEDAKVKIDKCVEEALLEQKADANSLMKYLFKTAFDKEYYFNKIFIEKNASYNVFCLFFNFFPRNINEFFNEIKSNSSDINFLRKIIAGLKGADDKITCNILENIFYLANRFLKMEILKTMQDFSKCNESFFISVLTTQDYLIKKQVMSIVVKNPSLRQKAAKVFLSLPNNFGVKNKLINENINIIGEFKLIEAKQELEKISRLKVFWKKSIKNAAINVLNEWKNGNN